MNRDNHLVNVHFFTIQLLSLNKKQKNKNSCLGVEIKYNISNLCIISDARHSGKMYLCFEYI